MTLTVDDLQQKYPLPENYKWVLTYVSTKISVQNKDGDTWWLFKASFSYGSYTVERDDPPWEAEAEREKHHLVATAPTLEEACALMYHLYLFDLRS